MAKCAVLINKCELSPPTLPRKHTHTPDMPRTRTRPSPPAPACLMYYPRASTRSPATPFSRVPSSDDTSSRTVTPSSLSNVTKRTKSWGWWESVGSLRRPTLPWGCSTLPSRTCRGVDLALTHLQGEWLLASCRAGGASAGSRATGLRAAGSLGGRLAMYSIVYCPQTAFPTHYNSFCELGSQYPVRQFTNPNTTDSASPFA